MVVAFHQRLPVEFFVATDNKFVRKFLLDGDKDYTDEKESKILYDYVETFDDMLKGYLSGKYNSMESLENRYIKYLGSGEIV